MSNTNALLYILSPLLLYSCSFKKPAEIRNDFKTYYDKYNVEGSFTVYDPQNNNYVFYNPDQYQQHFIPASTFKICSSLIGLETGVIKDENQVISWDSIIRQNPNWNKEHNLKSAFQNSVVWYYQEVARRVGKNTMKQWLVKTNYGNADTSGGTDQFWLTGGLRISPEQQIRFLKDLHDNNLPFSQRSLDIVKKIMVTKDTLGCTLRAKAGWGMDGNTDIGWYVGYLENEGKTYYFVNCIQNKNTDNQLFIRARTEITIQILKELSLLPSRW